jgi:hypothetical protein
MRFEDIGFLMKDIAQKCNVDAARMVTGDAMNAFLTTSEGSGFHLVASEDLNAVDGTPERLLLLSMQPRKLTERERILLRAMTLHAQMQLTAAAPST